MDHDAVDDGTDDEDLPRPGREVLPACTLRRLSATEQIAYFAGEYCESAADLEILETPLGSLAEVVVGSMDYALCNGQNQSDEELPARFLSRLGEGDPTLHAEFIMVWEMSPFSELIALLQSSPEALGHVLAVELPYETARFIEAKSIAASIAVKHAAQAALGELSG